MPNVVKRGDAFRLSSATQDQRSQPALAALPDGRFAAAWTEREGSGFVIPVQVFNPDGSRAGYESGIDSDPRFPPDPAMAALPNGGFVVAWTQGYHETSGAAVQPFGPGASGGWSIKSGQDEYAYAPSVASRPDGGYVLAWHDLLASGEVETELKVITAAGSDGGSIVIESDAYPNAYGPQVAVLSDGRMVVAWEGEDHDIHAALTTAAEQIFTVNSSTSGVQNDPVVTSLANGGFAVVWRDISGANWDIRGQVFDADGVKVNGPFLVNTTTSRDQFDPAIATLLDGRFVVGWCDTVFIDDSYQNIRIQLFNPDGSKSGDELLVNTPVQGFHSDPAITVLSDGRFVVAWDGDPAVTLTGTAENGEYAQIFDPRQGPVVLTGTPNDDNLAGTIFNDTITGAAGNDYLAGGPGDDTAVFSHAREQYTVTELDDRIVVTGPDGTDTLTGIEHLQFADPGPAPGPGPGPAPGPAPEPGPGPAPGPSAPDPFDHVSGLFDTEYYLNRYADVFAAGVSARDHYGIFGWHEGRAPNAFFDTVGYLGANPDVRDAGLNPLLHYHQTGWLDGRDPSASFDTRLYLLHNPDVVGVDPLEHYLQHGLSEGRAIYQAIGEHIVGGFDAEWYMLHNPDVAAAGVDARTHFDSFGWHEGRNPNGWFDTAGYLAHYTDVAAAGANPLEHYMTFGWREGRDASAGFDTLGYLAANPDVAAADVNPLEHFLTFGIYEGRAAVNDGMWH